MTKHILLVTIDTLRADYLACYGKRDIRTPNLDAVAGVRFDCHLTSIATTLPSHCSLMTGCTPAVHGITWNWMTTPCRRKFLARIGADAGYTTTAVTSWRHFNDQDVFGFERAYCEGVFKCEGTLADATVQRAKAWLDDTDLSRPQLWWVSFIDPHAPDTCPDPYPKTYVGEVEFTDVWIGELLRHWDKRIGLDETLVVITADHGEDLNSHAVHDTGEPFPHYIATLRNAEYAFHFVEERNLAHIFDLRSDPGEETDLRP